MNRMLDTGMKRVDKCGSRLADMLLFGNIDGGEKDSDKQGRQKHGKSQNPVFECSTVLLAHLEPFVFGKKYKLFNYFHYTLYIFVID